METNAQYFHCLCRTCMNKVEASSQDGTTKPQQQWISIFDRIEECGQLQIAELLSEAVPQIEVQASDELPKKICPECQQRLLIAYRFQQMCVQSDKQMHELLTKEQTIMKAPMLKEAIKGETEEHDADSEPLKYLPCISTLQNLQQPSIQESLSEVTVQTNKQEAAQTSAADHLQDIKLIEQCIDVEGEFEEFIKNEPIEDDEEANSEYSDDDTMHSTISVTNDEPKEFEDQQVNVTSSRHNCHLCNKSYKRREYLRRHLNNHKKKATNRKEYCYACSLCGESYKEQRFLSRHLNLEHPNSKSNASSEKTVPAKPHECDICGKKFRLNAGLTIHKRIHSTEKPHKCDLCEKQFVQFHDLKMHIRKHTGEKPYKCKYCECAFTTGSARMNHLRCHLGDNIYRCNLCTSAFRFESERRLHLTTHNNEDPETRERNLKALREEEAKLVLNFSKEKSKGQSTEEQQQQMLSNKEIEQPSTERDEFGAFVINEPIEDDNPNTEYSDGFKMRSIISVMKDEPTEPEYEQVNEARDEFREFTKNDSIEEDKSNTEYSDGNTLHSTISATKDETSPIEPEHQQVNDESSLKSNAASYKTVHEGAAKRHECDICGKCFRRLDDLKKHKRSHSKEKPHKCDLCEKQYAQFHDLKLHKRKHAGVKPYKCKYCELAFTTCGARMKHLRCHLGDNIYRCNLCPLAFPLESDMRLHLTSHKNDNPETRERHLKALQEEEAKLVLKFSKEKGEGQSTEDQQQQKSPNKEIEQPSTERGEHIEDDNPNTDYSHGDTMHSTMSVMKDEPTAPEDEEVHDAYKNIANSKESCHVCHVCGESYLKKGFLARHLSQEHSIESKGYICEFCNKSFKAPVFLRRHIRTHTGERPYSCSECGKTFNQEGILAQHRKIHSGNMPYECPYCPLRFSSKSVLKRHSIIHEEGKGHECDTCGKRFSIKCDLARHKLYHSEEKPHNCDSCGKQFFFIWQLQIHIRTHTGEKPYKCKYCERGFISTTLLNQHLRSHLGKNIYGCEFCPLAFPLESELRLHLPSHKNEDPETRARNLKALQEEEAKFKLKYSKKEIENSSTEEQQQQKFSKKDIEPPSTE